MLKDFEEGPAMAARCAGCGGPIQDRYFLLAVDRQWHAPCLKCSQCKLTLDRELTCFARDGNIFCKDDYYRMFSVTKCGKCHLGISANELVMRARDFVFHLNCFSCTFCGTPLAKGDYFGIRHGLVYCRPHYEIMDNFDQDLQPFSDSPPPSHHFFNHTLKGRPRKRKVPPPTSSLDDTLEMLQHDNSDLSSSMESLAYDSSVTSPASSNGHHQTQRNKRMRTSFKHHQLRTMKTYFAINQNPDAKDLKQLAQKTGLSKRVLQVWFQNARAKWRRNLMRQENGGGTLGNHHSNHDDDIRGHGNHHMMEQQRGDHSNSDHSNQSSGNVGNKNPSSPGLDKSLHLHHRQQSSW